MSARQKAIVGGHISGGTVFPNMFIRLASEVKSIVDENHAQLNSLVDAIMRRLKKDLGMALKLPANSTAETPRRVNPDINQIKAFEKQTNELKSRLQAIALDE